MNNVLNLLFNLLTISFILAQRVPEKETWSKLLHFENRKSQITSINRTEAKENAYPYHVGISPYCYLFYCSGSLITETMVLTTATCAEFLQECGRGDLYFGYNNLAYETSIDQQIIAFKNILIHEDFPNDNDKLNDIAIIELQYPVKLNRIIKTVKLDQSVFDHSQQNGLVTGWGNTLGINLKPINLTYFENTILSNSDCKDINSELYTLIQPFHICLAGDDNNKIYGPGDAGSPLVVEGVQVGIGSFSQGDISVFTRVATFESWIKEKCSDCKFGETSRSNNIQTSWLLIVIFSLVLFPITYY